MSSPAGSPRAAACHLARRLVAAVAGFALVVLGLVITSAPASARPNCDVPNPPPICEPPVPVPVDRLPDLTATVSGPTSGVGATVAAYTVRVANPSGRNAAIARAVSVRIAARGGATVTSAASSGWTCTVAAGVATCSGGTIAVGGSASIPVNVKLPSAAATVSVSAAADPSNAIAERSESNNTGSASTVVTTPVLPDLQLRMTGPDSVSVYADAVWTMTISNVGSAPADVVNVQWLTNWGGDMRASAMTSGAIGFSCPIPPLEYVQQFVHCSGNGPLQPGASATIAITARPPAPGDVYGPYGQSNVTGTVDYAQLVTESNESNNAATVVSTITP